MTTHNAWRMALSCNDVQDAKVLTIVQENAKVLVDLFFFSDGVNVSHGLAADWKRHKKLSTEKRMKDKRKEDARPTDPSCSAIPIQKRTLKSSFSRQALDSMCRSLNSQLLALRPTPSASQKKCHCCSRPLVLWFKKHFCLFCDRDYVSRRNQLPLREPPRDSVLIGQNVSGHLPCTNAAFAT